MSGYDALDDGTLHVLGCRHPAAGGRHPMAGLRAEVPPDLESRRLHRLAVEGRIVLLLLQAGGRPCRLREDGIRHRRQSLSRGAVVSVRQPDPRHAAAEVETGGVRSAALHQHGQVPGDGRPVRRDRDLPSHRIVAVRHRVLPGAGNVAADEQPRLQRRRRVRDLADDGRDACATSRPAACSRR